MPEITCEVCGRRRSYGQADINRGGGKYCSRACYYKSKRTQIEFTCEVCGGIGHYRASRPAGRYCSRKCTGIAKRKDNPIKSNPAYESWRAMRKRCLDPKNHNYARYGGRGIRVCDRWLNSFEAFLHDVGERPPGTTLDRIDCDRGYEPGNCRWATPKTQARNRRNTITVSVDGSEMPLAEYAEVSGIKYATLFQRMKRD